jgi:hypothetical protein
MDEDEETVSRREDTICADYRLIAKADERFDEQLLQLRGKQ